MQIFLVRIKAFAPLLADLIWYSYEAEFLRNLFWDNNNKI
jgi:hypothetical protein